MEAHCLCSSSGPRASHTELLPAPRDCQEPPKNAEAKPIYWLIGRQCRCRGVEELGERLFLFAPYARRVPPLLPRLTEPAAVPN